MQSFAKCIMTLKCPGQSSADFAQEVKALSPEDRAWYAQAFRDAGIDCADPRTSDEAKAA